MDRRWTYSAINNLDSKYVHLGTAQSGVNETIYGTKTFANDIYTTRTQPSNILRDSEYDVSFDGIQGRYEIQEKNGRRVGMVRVETHPATTGISTPYSLTRLTAHARNPNDVTQEYSSNLEVIVQTDGTGFVTAPSRITNMALNDVITKRTLEGVDHTFTGINTFNTVRFNSNPQKMYNGTIDERPSSYVVCGDFQFMDKSNAAMGFLRRDKTSTNERTLIYTRAKIGNDFIGGRLMIEVTPQGIVVLSIAKETNTVTTQSYEIWRSTQ